MATAEHNVVFGWASVISQDGVAVVDAHDHVIEPSELAKAATEFMAVPWPAARVMHDGLCIAGTVIHSLPLTAALAKALDIRTDREGWIVGILIDDDEVLEAVERGELGGLSIAGDASHVPF
jgi:hypothetical protein